MNTFYVANIGMQENANAGNFLRGKHIAAPRCNFTCSKQTNASRSDHMGRRCKLVIWYTLVL
jgi:hypothetical protein